MVTIGTKLSFAMCKGKTIWQQKKRTNCKFSESQARRIESKMKNTKKFTFCRGQKKMTNLYNTEKTNFVLCLTNYDQRFSSIDSPR